MAYRERPAHQQLRSVLLCTWSSDPAADTHLAQRVVPDACIDVIWRSDGQLLIAGPDTAPRFAEQQSFAHRGLRFRPGAAPALLGLPATELRDQTLPLDEAWDRATVSRLLDQIAHATDQAESLLEAELAHRLVQTDHAPDAAVLSLAARLARGRASLADIADQIGLSERQLRRRCEAAIGYGPKLLHEVLRFQRARKLATHSQRSLAQIAAEAGYADQAHLTREYRRFSGTTPREHLKTAS